jgi:hypothetical protein
MMGYHLGEKTMQDRVHNVIYCEEVSR